MSTIFISYSWKDKTKVLPIIAKYKQVGKRVWVDYEQLDLTKPIRPQIIKGISECDEFIQFVSRNAMESPWVNFEYDCAIEIKEIKKIKRIYLNSLISNF